jgi:hypothetical protein
MGVNPPDLVTGFLLADHVRQKPDFYININSVKLARCGRRQNCTTPKRILSKHVVSIMRLAEGGYGTSIAHHGLGVG